MTLLNNNNNRDGNIVDPVGGISVAEQDLAVLPTTVALLNVSTPTTYPMLTFEYAVFNPNMYQNDCPKLTEMAKFLQFCVNNSAIQQSQDLNLFRAYQP